MSIESLPRTDPPVVARVLAYRSGQIEEDVPIDSIDGLLADPSTVVWVDVECPSVDALAALQREFGLHPLAVQDLGLTHQRPKVDDYGATSLVVLFAAALTTDGHLQRREVDLFAGSRFLITIHRVPIPTIDQIRARWLQDPAMVEPSPVGFLVYRIAQALVAEYFPLVDALEDSIDDIEEHLFGKFDQDVLRQIFALRRDLIELRRALGPQRDVFTTLSRHDDPIFDSTTIAYFADLVDLILRLTDTVDTMRDRLSVALESYLTLQSNALNVTMKRLTALTVVVALPTLVAGVYGMNFRVIPELDWALGYPFAIVLMAVLVVAALALFRARDWM